MEFGYVYWIKNPQNINDINDGYIGVVHKEKGIEKRFHEHRTSKSHMRARIREYNVVFEDHVEMIYSGPIKDCYSKERELRSDFRIGWNIDMGGRGYYYTSEIDNLSEFRSNTQINRMKNEELKKTQGEKFKENYYNSPESQALRKLRAKEHMSNPEKKEKCLSAIHKKEKCPYCDHENNKSNLSRHIKKQHPEKKHEIC